MLVGILVDVSGSMKNVLQLNTKPADENITRIQSVFDTIMKIIKQEDQFGSTQNVFVGAFGLEDVATCDLLALLDYTQRYSVSILPGCGHDHLIRLLAQHGAPYSGKYVREHLTQSEAGFFFKFFSENPEEMPQIIERLPDVCKERWTFNDAVLLGNTFLSYTMQLPNYGQVAAKEKTDAMITYAKSIIRKHSLLTLKDMAKPQVKSFLSTVDLLQRIAGQSSSSTLSSFTSEHLSNLVAAIEPFIYGSTPMCQALSSAADIFESSTDPVKILFLISDGQSTDGDPTRFAKRLHDNNVIVFSCLLTDQHLPQPRRLYYEPERSWIEAQKHMFQLGSTVVNTHPAMSLLLEQRWELPAAGHSRLFVQANHPDVINEYSDLVQRIATKNDVLLNIIGRVSLDQYINAANSSFEPKKQIRGTCYAHAIAAVFHLAMRRIEGREKGVPETVLNYWAPKYRLHFKQVDELGARQAINHRRPVIATFWLDKMQWKNFSNFYQRLRQGILESKDIGIQTQSETGGHAVVLIGCDPNSLMLMNS